MEKKPGKKKKERTVGSEEENIKIMGMMGAGDMRQDPGPTSPCHCEQPAHGGETGANSDEGADGMGAKQAPSDDRVPIWAQVRFFSSFLFE